MSATRIDVIEQIFYFFKLKTQRTNDNHEIVPFHLFSVQMVRQTILTRFDICGILKLFLFFFFFCFLFSFTDDKRHWYKRGGKIIILQSHGMRVQRENRVRYEREVPRAEILPAPSALSAAAKYEESTAKKIVSLNTYKFNCKIAKYVDESNVRIIIRRLIDRCRCPSDFTPKITPDGECQCYCYEHNQNCIKTKRGKGYFSLSDRL